MVDATVSGDTTITIQIIDIPSLVARLALSVIFGVTCRYVMPSPRQSTQATLGVGSCAGAGSPLLCRRDSPHRPRAIGLSAVFGVVCVGSGARCVQEASLAVKGSRWAGDLLRLRPHKCFHATVGPKAAQPLTRDMETR